MNAAAKSLPDDMPPAERASAQRSKVNDILIVLERDREMLETNLAGRARALVDANGGTPGVKLTFAADAPAFVVAVDVGEAGETVADRAGLGRHLAVAVREELLAHIGRRATSSGRWEAIVMAEPRHLARHTNPPATAWRSAAWLGIFTLLAVATAAAGYVMWAR